MSPIEQVEFMCPHCRKRTIARHEEEVYCSRCDVPMQPQEPKTAAAAAANAPTRSGDKAAAKSTKTRAKAAKTTKTTKTSKAAAKAATAVIEPDVPQPVEGEYRCACCGYGQFVEPGEKKPGTILRCPTCFVKLEKFK